jgi:hypothetical protein
MTSHSVNCWWVSCTRFLKNANSVFKPRWFSKRAARHDVIFCFNYYFLGGHSPWNSEEILPPLHAHSSSVCPCMAFSPMFHLDSVGSTVCQSAHPAVYQPLLIQLFVRSASQSACAFSYLHFNLFAFSTSAFSTHIFSTFTFTT